MASVGYATLQVIPSLKGLDRTIGDGLKAPLKRAGEESGEVAAKGFAESFKAKAKAGLAAAGIGASAALSKGFVDNLSIGAGRSKLTAQLGLTGAQSKEAGKVAGSLYSNAYGDSLGQVNDALASVVQNIDGMRNASAPILKDVTAKVLDVATAFDQDLGGVTRAVGQAIRTGLAKNSTEALDFITVGLQRGNDKAGDFLDTLNEYGTQFRKVGIDGKTATGLISQGLQAGARDSDVVADAIKEFSIRAIDGSKLTAQGFQSIGLDATKMSAAIAKGGPTAAKALDTTLDRLRAIEDPAKRSQAAVALFGTQAEDLGESLFALDPSKAVKGLGDVAGAADKLDKVLGDNNATTLAKFQRRFELAFAGAADAIGPVLALAPGLAGVLSITGKFDGVLGKLGKGGKKLGSGLASGLSSAASSTASFGKSALVAAGNIAKQTAAFVASKAAALAAAAAQKVMTAAQWLLNAAMTANPVGLIVAGIAALAAGIFIAYKKFGPFRAVVDALWQLFQKVFNWIKGNWPKLLLILTGPFGLAVVVIKSHWSKITGAAQAAFDWVKKNWPLLLAILTGPIGLAVLAITKNWDTIKNGVKSVFGAVRSTFNNVVSFVRGIPGRILAALGDFGRLLYDIGADLIQGLVDGIKNAWHRVTDLIGDLASHLPGFIKGPLGISSPSKVFHGIGGNLMDGLANGIAAGWGRVDSQLATISDRIKRTPLELAEVKFGGAAAFNKAVKEGQKINQKNLRLPTHADLVAGANFAAAAVKSKGWIGQAILANAKQPRRPVSHVSTFVPATASQAGSAAVQIVVQGNVYGDPHLRQIVRKEIVPVLRANHVPLVPGAPGNR